MNIVGVANECEFKIKNSENIKKIILRILKSKDIEDKELSVVFLNKNKIRELNKKYRGLDRATDVLSFEGEKDFLGEIAISPEVILQRSGEENFKKDLAQVLIHGVLHLLGYDHNKKKKREEMREEEGKISSKLKIQSSPPKADLPRAENKLK